jgi:hypothetical protein
MHCVVLYRYCTVRHCIAQRHLTTCAHRLALPLRPYCTGVVVQCRVLPTDCSAAVERRGDCGADGPAAHVSSRHARCDQVGPAGLGRCQLSGRFDASPRVGVRAAAASCGAGCLVGSFRSVWRLLRASTSDRSNWLRGHPGRLEQRSGRCLPGTPETRVTGLSRPPSRQSRATGAGPLGRGDGTRVSHPITQGERQDRAGRLHHFLEFCCWRQDCGRLPHTLL